ncbi:MAG: PKD domain-containing protein, partial [Gemmatimonadetes bacterium]|nr:PKD domain-containing protein [Gemmatimonadota bacterium]
PTANRVFLCTSDNSFDDGGSLWESPDGGATWIQRDVPFSLAAPLNSMFFLDDLHGWTVGNANYRTTDGGDTWTELPALGSAYFVEFYTPTFGVTGGNFSRYFTTDAGDTWNPSPNGEFRFDFADASLGLGVSDTGLSRTTDGGTTITPVLAGDADAVAFLSSTVALAIVDGTFQRSTDGGATWTAGADADGRSELLAVTPNVVLAWGRAGTFPDYDDRILRSDDGGQTWTDLGEPMPQGVWALVSPDANTVVGADNAGGMHHSGDAGQTWQSTFVSPGPFPGFLSSAVPAFGDASHGYFGYGAGFAIRTTDGGATWSQISSGTGSTINDMDAFPNGDLIAVGENGTVMTSAQGLGPWTLAPRFTTSHLTAVQVLGPTDVMLVETDGRVHHSSDAGATWTAAASVPTSFEAADLHFEDPLDGWVVGFGFGPGALYHTTDGGGTWTPETGFAGAYTALDFEGDNGWAANVGGLVYRSTDAGASWSSVLLPGDFISLEDLDFWDVSTGYAVGRFGWAVRSDDAGATWQILPTPNDTDMFTDIYLLGPNELWLSTADDRAYYTANGGQGWAVLDINSGGFGSFSSIVANADGDAWTGGFLGFLEYFQGPPPAPLNRPPDASFDFVTTGMTVDLTDTSSDPDGVVVSWAWDFGDGSTSTEQNPTHTFVDPNTYIVRLTVTDDDGDTGSTVRFIVAQPGPGGTFGDFTEVTPLDPLFVTPQDEDFWVSTTAPADYDGDGDLDVAVLGFYVWYNVDFEFRLVLFRNDGPAGADEWEFSYVDVPLGSLSVGLSDLAWGDVDADGDQDLVVGSDGQTVIYRNDA